MYTKGCCVTCSKSYHWLVNKGRRKLCRASMAGLMTMRENREMNSEQKAPLGRWIVRAWSWGLANWHKGDPGRIWQIIPHGFWQESGLNSLEGLHLSSSSGSKASYTYKCYVSFFFFFWKLSELEISINFLYNRWAWTSELEYLHHHLDGSPPFFLIPSILLQASCAYLSKHIHLPISEPCPNFSFQIWYYSTTSLLPGLFRDCFYFNQGSLARETIFIIPEGCAHEQSMAPRRGCFAAVSYPRGQVGSPLV